jgi:hypothetical protein
VLKYKIEVFKMVKTLIKRTGSPAYIEAIEPNDDSKILYLGTIYESIYMGQEFKNRNIEVVANPGSYETGIEPNIFVVILENKIPCERILFGNVLFFKKENDKYVDLEDSDIEFLNDYLSKYDMTENEKAMAGLFEYSASEIGQRFNK